MKKVLMVSLALLLMFSLVACGENVDTDSESSEITTTEAVKAESSQEESQSKNQDKDLLIGEQSAEIDCFMTDIMTKVTLTVPDSGWYYKKSTGDVRVYNVPSEDDAYSNSPVIIIKCKETLEKINFYIDDFENLQDIANRTIGGVEMKGRTYKNVGMDWTEYYAEHPNGAWVSISISKIDLSDGSEGSAILDSISLEDAS